VRLPVNNLEDPESVPVTPLDIVLGVNRRLGLTAGDTGRIWEVPIHRSRVRPGTVKCTACTLIFDSKFGNDFL